MKQSSTRKVVWILCYFWIEFINEKLKDFLVFGILVAHIETSQLICNNSYLTGFSAGCSGSDSVTLNGHINKIWVNKISSVVFSHLQLSTNTYTMFPSYRIAMAPFQFSYRIGLLFPLNIFFSV